MKISTFVPFGSHSQESGLIYLLGNYLKGIYPEVSQLRCNGAFSLCDRDVDNSWNRTISSCFNCIGDQRALSDWSALPVVDFSSFISPQDISDSKRWAAGLGATELTTAEFRGVQPYSLCQQSFANRFGSVSYDASNKNHEQFLRRVLLSTLRACMGAQEFHARFAPDICLISGGQDFITSSFLSCSKALRRDVALFKWDVSKRVINISHPRQDSSFASELVPEGVLSMRSDYKTWPRELVTIVQDILSFLQLGDGQLKLPIAR